MWHIAIGIDIYETLPLASIYVTRGHLDHYKWHITNEIYIHRPQKVYEH